MDASIGNDDGLETAEAGVYRSGYFETRLAENPYRSTIWRHICTYLRRWVTADDDVLELGAGWCDFSNEAKARAVTAMDIDSVVARAARPGVTAVVVAVYTDRSLRDMLTASGWQVQRVEARFLPLRMKSRGSGLTFLVPWYLRSPVRPFAGQMLVRATRRGTDHPDVER